MAVQSPVKEIANEQELLAALRRGDSDAYEKIVLATAGYLFAIGKRMLHNETDAQDAVQDAMIQVYKSVAKFEGRSSLQTWMHRIMVTTCLMKLRSKKREDETPIENLLPTFRADGHQAGPSKSWHGGPAEQLAKDELRSKVRSCIDRLPETYRTILILRDIEQLSTEETCNVLQINESVAKTRLHRARQALKTLLDPLFAGSDGEDHFLSLLLFCFTV